MKLFLRRNSPVLYMMLAMVVLYAPWMGRGYVNLEYPFSMAARALSDSRYAGQIDTYFAVQANPLGYSFVLAIIYKIFGYHDWFWLAKLPSLCGALMILVSGWMLTRDRWQSRRSLFYIWCGLVILHPMIIAFGTAATADVLPVGLLMLAIAIAIKSADNEIVSKIVAALLFGFSIIVKYNSVYFAGAFLAVAFLKRSKKSTSVTLISRDVAIFASFPLITLVTYIVWLNAKFNVFVSNGLAGGSPNFFNVLNWSLTFGKYLSFLGLFIGIFPLVMILNETRQSSERLKKLVIMVGLVLIGWFVLSWRVMGEMDFGGGFYIASNRSRILETFGFLSGVFVCLFVFRQFRNHDRVTEVLISGLAPYLLLISASRPSQRYLIYIVPISLLLLIYVSDVLSAKLRNLTLGLTALGFAAVSLLGMSYLRAQGNASENMAVWMEQNRVIDQSSASPIGVHAGQHFYGITSSEIKYEVIQTSLEGEKLITERILHREAMNVLGKITRVYVLRELPKIP
ncbi:MAG: hypothetical protein F2712_00850 [Actinobacteria bacterium]|uniref:Unannotated protein n=1 Tax=freshwater metagenome TaxID=449393 RepID=A0A6J6TW07_9ZZZZ|nr:hypothetical protein [Actinomycetota bacterium]